MMIQLDVLASWARTALSDPAGIPDGDMAEYHYADRPYEAYALDKLDTIINTLSPPTETRETFALGLRTLGTHIAELQDNMRTPALDDPEPQRTAYAETIDALETALNSIDLAIRTLEDDNDLDYSKSVYDADEGWIHPELLRQEEHDGA